MARRQVTRGDVFVVDLDPTVGSEIQKRRPCLVVSPDELNEHLRTVIVVPLSSHRGEASFRVSSQFRGMEGNIMIDQIRAVSRERLVRRMGAIDAETLSLVLKTLREVFRDSA